MTASRRADAPPAIVTRAVAALADLPPEADRLFAVPGEGSLFATRAWFACALDAALPPDTRACFVTLEAAGRVLALVPMLRSPTAGRAAALTTPYTCLYRPLLAPGLSATMLAALGGAYGRFCRGWPTVRLDAMPDDDPDLAAFLAGTRRAGLGRAGFLHFGNWHEAVGGLDWAGYLAARPGELRETVRRKLARAERDRTVAFEILRLPAEVPRAVAAYETVYATSWKPAEPFPAFNPLLIARTAALGVLRLGVLRLGDEPVAVQFWVVSGGEATVLKLAHDERAKALSPGTVLTAMMIRHLLDGENVRAIDFGRGDDGYKQGWARERRSRIGVVLFDPRRPAGFAFAARHLVGRALRRLRGA